MSIYFDEYESGSYAGSDDKSGAGSGAPKMGYGGNPTRYGPGANDWTWAFGSPSDFRRSPNSGRLSTGRGSRTSSGSRTSTSTMEFTMPRPGQPKLPTLEMPRVDKRAVAALAQKAAAPGIRGLRETVQQAMGQSYDNPNVRRMTLREALQGYGAGLERVMSGAQHQARQEHQQDLSLLAAERQANFQSQVQLAMDSYNKAWSEYLASAKKVTTTTEESEAGGGGEWRRGPGMGLYFIPSGSTWKPVSPG